MRRVLAAVVLVLCAREARSEEPDAGDPFEEPTLTLGAVTARLDGTEAHFAVGFAMHVPGPAIHQGIVLELPHHALVTGATLRVEGQLHRLDLAATSDAASAFEALLDREGGPKRQWAARISRQFVLTTLDLAAPRTAEAALELEVSAPTCFRRDVRLVAVPKEWAPSIDTMLLSREPAEELDAACALDNTNDEHVWVELPAPELARHAALAERIGTTAQGLAVHGERIARVELDLAGRLGEIPRDLATAIVIDGSRSLTAQEMAAQRAVVEAYLRAAPRGRVQVIAYAHTARALLPGWMTASFAMPRVDRELRDLDLRNGSDVDLGLIAASAWLARTGGTHRIVLLTDERFSARMLEASPLALGKLVAPGTLVQVVAITGDESALARDDQMTLAPLAQSTHGIAVRGGLPTTGVDAELLVRPITFDEVTVTAPGWMAFNKPDGRSCGFVDVAMAEGSSCTWWAEGTPNAGPITVEGLVWGRRVTRVMQPDLGKSRTLARELADAGGVGEALQEEVEREAHAVTDHFALIGMWGGRDGYEDVEHGGFGFGTSGCGCGGDLGTSIGIGTIGSIGHVHLDLEHQLGAAIAACHRGDHKVDITLETTLQEIVGVSLDISHAADESIAALHDCIEAAIWDTNIALANPPAHTTTVVSL
jgi:von Willebrand factor type A domain